MFGNKELIAALSKEVGELSMKVSRLETDHSVDRYLTTIMYEFVDELVEWEVISPKDYYYETQFHSLNHRGFTLYKIYADSKQLWIKKKNKRKR